jgi:hypothetical protein
MPERGVRISSSRTEGRIRRNHGRSRLSNRPAVKGQSTNSPWQEQDQMPLRPPGLKPEDRPTNHASTARPPASIKRHASRRGSPSAMNAFHSLHKPSIHHTQPASSSEPRNHLRPRRLATVSRRHGRTRSTGQASMKPKILPTPASKSIVDIASYLHLDSPQPNASQPVSSPFTSP